MLKNTNQIDGWLVIDKPLEMGSTQVVSSLKRALSPAKIGHAGTLDPLATGVLPIALGKATKLIPYVMDGTKTYDFQVTWGAETETDDRAGGVTSKSDKRPTEADVRMVLQDFIGVIEQMPPVYSALKINGQRAYDLARRGEDVSLKERAVRIDELHLLRFGTDTADFRVVCGKGTYVRSLGRDIGRKLGCLGYITALRRMACGPFRIEDSLPISAFKGICEGVKVLPMEMALGKLPKWACTLEEWNRLKQGQRLSVKTMSAHFEEGETVCLMVNGQVCGLAQIRQGVCHPHRIFA